MMVMVQRYYHDKKPTFPNPITTLIYQGKKGACYSSSAYLYAFAYRDTYTCPTSFDMLIG